MQIRDILRNNVKEKLKRDEVVASMTVRLIRGVEIARIAATAGFDTLYVDLEHSSFSLETCGQICIAALEAGIAPFVRVPANTPDYIARVLEGATPLPVESASLQQAHGRVLAADVVALRTQPPENLSAMDGYAVRSADVQSVPTTLDIIGEVAAGHPFPGHIDKNQAARIFTGGVVPPVSCAPPT